MSRMTKKQFLARQPSGHGKRRQSKRDTLFAQEQAFYRRLQRAAETQAQNEAFKAVSK